MARTPIDERPPLAQWLIRARASRGDGYTAEVFIEELRSEMGTAPNLATYRQWESGATTPKEASLTPVVAFWQARGVAGPVLTPAPTISLEERAVIAAEAQAATLADLLTEQIEANRLMAARLDALEALVSTLTAPLLADPTALEAMRSWGRDALDRSRTRAPRPDPSPSGGR